MTRTQKALIIIAVLALVSDLTAAVVGLALLSSPAPLWWLVWIMASLGIAVTTWIAYDLLSARTAKTKENDPA